MTEGLNIRAHHKDSTRQVKTTRQVKINTTDLRAKGSNNLKTIGSIKKYKSKWRT